MEPLSLIGFCQRLEHLAHAITPLHCGVFSII
nr:MAG TPA: hypothetical protein [Caudoviricetes sp.]